LSFQFRSEISDEPVTCECAYVHWLYDYYHEREEHAALLDRGIKILYESEPPVVYLVPINFILGKLPVVKVGDTGRISHHLEGSDIMLRENSNGTSDTLEGNGKIKPTGSQLYYVNKYAMEWSNEISKSN
jgi:hypothetical protein